MSFDGVRSGVNGMRVFAEAVNGSEQFVPVTMVITAVVFLLAVLPTFAWLKERARPQPLPDGGYAGVFARIWHTVQHAREYRDLMRFLVCILFYQAGVQSVITLAAIYAVEAMGFQTNDTIMLILVVNLTASLGALAFGHIQDRIGHKSTIVLTLLGWLLTIGVAWMAQTPGVFWIAANLAGLCLGASQSAGRALVGYLSPAQRRAEFFGLWGFAVKLSSIFGPLTYGAVSWLTGGDHECGDGRGGRQQPVHAGNTGKSLAGAERLRRNRHVSVQLSQAGNPGRRS